MNKLSISSHYGGYYYKYYKYYHYYQHAAYNADPADESQGAILPEDDSDARTAKRLQL